MDYKVQFRGGKTQTDKFKGDLYHYVETAITRFFDYDGDTLQFVGNNEDIIKIRQFAVKYQGETIIN